MDVKQGSCGCLFCFCGFSADRITRWGLLALFASYIVFGTFGHDPWKSEDAVHIAIIRDFLTGGNWLIPSIAGQHWPDAEPLYHWIGAIFASMTQNFLVFHDAARLTSALFTSLFLLLLAAASRQFNRQDESIAWTTPLLAIGTLGLLVPLHEAQPAAAVLAAITAFYYGLSLRPTRPMMSATIMGVSFSGLFLSGGLSAALPVAPLLLLPAINRAWLSFGIAVLLATAGCLIWPLSLAEMYPGAFASWWQSELQSLEPHLFPAINDLQWLSWFAWPIIFLAPWTLWVYRRQWREPQFAIPAFGAGLAFIWFMSHEARIIPALPIIPPLLILAAAGVSKLRRGAANAWDWFGMMTLSLVVALLWLGAVAMTYQWPPKIARYFSKNAPGFSVEYSWLALGLALLATAAWVLVLTRLPRSPYRVSTRWAAGVSVIWVLSCLLWLPWIDYGKTYRPVVMAIRQVLPVDANCVSQSGLSASQRAALDYFGQLRPIDAQNPEATACGWLLRQGNQQESSLDGWQLYWSGHRPGDNNEWFRLYQRINAEPPTSH